MGGLKSQYFPRHIEAASPKINTLLTTNHQSHLGDDTDSGFNKSF